jgi:hypothetical protein
MSAPYHNLASVLRNAHAVASQRPVLPWAHLRDCEQYKWTLLVDAISAEYASDPLFSLSGEWLYTTWAKTLLLSVPHYRQASPKARRCWEFVAKAGRSYMDRLEAQAREERKSA